MTANRFGKKLLKIAGYIFGGLAVLVIAFNFWLIHYAKGMLEDIVSKKSNGKIKLKIEKLSFDYFNNRFKLKKAVFITTDTATAPASYRFDIKEIRLRLKALWPFVFQKKLLIDSLHLQSPDIVVTNFRYPAGDSIKNNKKDISIPNEMGKVYNSIQDALKLLQVNRFQIDDGKFTLLNKIQPGQLPLVISNIDFHIDNLQVDTSKLTGKEKLFFSDNVVLKSNNQQITFPDGRHHLNFNRFRINIRKKLVEFDSCTISSAKTDSTRTSFSVFFDKLLLSNIDFDTLYKNDVIKADTVFCLNPQFKLYTESSGKKGTGKSPKLETIIQQLTGDLSLGNVIVNNASFDITRVKNGLPNSFKSHENNFEMQGLSINQDDEKPIKVKSFAMAIRNYENFMKDSSYSVQFDSVLFKDNHISLSNFLFHKLEKGRIINTFNIPHFYLVGLSWDDLVFDKRIIAERATMLNPYISYTVSEKGKEKKNRRNIFQSLDSINNYMDLQYLDIVNGTIDLKIKDNFQMKLEDASLSIKSHSLLAATKIAEIKNSVTTINFGHGEIRAGSLGMTLEGIRYISESGQLGAASIRVLDKEKNMNLFLQDVDVEKLQVDEQTGSVFADGIKWRKGDVTLNIAGTGKNKSAASLELRNVEGSNTSINTIWGNKTISTKINSISFNSLVKKAGSKVELDGLAIDGKQLKLTDNDLILSVADYHVADNKNSSFGQIKYKSDNSKTSADISIPSLTGTPHIQSLINGDIAFDNINISKPVIKLQLAKKDTAMKGKQTSFPEINISAIRLTQPEIHFMQANDSGAVSFQWYGEKHSSNFLQLLDLHSNQNKTGLSLKNLGFFMSDFVFTTPKGETFNPGNGKIAAQLRDINFEQETDQPLTWKAVVSNLDANDFKADSVGKKKGSFIINKATLAELHISSANINSPQKLVNTNLSFQLKQLNGQYVDQDKSFQWFNGSFDRRNNTFSIDSFIFRQALDKEAFVAKQKFQADYINAKTGMIRIGPIDIDGYFKDTALKIGRITIDNGLLTDFRDKTPPIATGIIKPLPVNLIKKIPVRMAIDSVILNNTRIDYTETGEKSKDPGTIPITRMKIIFINVKNYNYSQTDSLRIHANGYLMDSVWTRLRVKESYIDSLAGFLMTVRMKPADLTVFNPVLIPLSSVKLESAYLDTLSMRAMGKEYIAFGEMKMFYHDLKVRFLKNGDETKKSFLNGLITFIANSFVIRNKNTSRSGLVFFIRMRDRSAINYLVKIAMSGIASSVGAKSSKKMMRKYEKDLKHHKLPPFELD